jgi:hypothetical protein
MREQDRYGGNFDGYGRRRLDLRVDGAAIAGVR